MNLYRPESHGWIEVISGPMYSGKSSSLMARIRREVIAGKRAMVFKPAIDDRYSTEEIMTHDGEKLHANSIICRLSEGNEPRAVSREILEQVHPSVDAVGIDEGQFFDEDLVEVCETLANRGLRVIVAGVDMDYRCLPWAPMSDLMSVAEFVEKLPAVCFKCGRPATKIQRFTKGHYSHWYEPTIVVGSNIAGDKHQYEARCRKCYVAPPKLIQGGKQDE
ncbi:Thymidine kinase [compost metagenome]